MTRLFVAVDPPPTVKDQLLDLNEEEMAGVRWSGFDRFHLTLRFVGEVHDGIARDIDEVLATLTTQPFDLRLSSPGFFADRRRARVLWVGLEKSHDLTSLNRKVERLLTELGLPPVFRKFRPHITLARSKTLSRAAAEDYCARHQGFQSETFRVDKIHLFSSQLTRAGAHYRIEADYPLATAVSEVTSPV